MNQIFNRLSARFSYTFAVAVFSAFGGQGSAALGFLFILLITDLSPERPRLHLAAIVGGVMAATLIHYILFGRLHSWDRQRRAERRFDPGGGFDCKWVTFLVSSHRKKGTQSALCR